ncbi:DUF6199 family natural product biosynthesis protein [Mycolicibacterium arseniciresistens]|uniref:DUF6199 domain-containing protein n=1 Tax=Mycolicibacterium arseniciresistens TaxID=3062257 RepID=A0ABT8UGB6_9MYCO|nr:hypothetical protein [Mycolicibacterium arseniciresistens]
MALGILVLLIGIPIGVWLFRNPDKLWWATESWKYKNPEANEPSEAAYGMSSLTGVLVIVASVVVALLAFTSGGSNDDDAPSRPATTTTKRTPPTRAGLTSRPQDRGALPIVGYRLAEQGGATMLDLSYLVPAGSAPVAGGFNFFTEQGCEVMRQVRGIGTDRITADLRLGWTPGLKATLAGESTCRVTDAWSPGVATIRVGTIRPDASIVTNSAVVRPDGTVLAPAAAGNPVPHLPGAQ